MSSCIKDLYDYDLVRKCLKNGNISLKSNFKKKIEKMVYNNIVYPVKNNIIKKIAID